MTEAPVVTQEPEVVTTEAPVATPAPEVARPRLRRNRLRRRPRPKPTPSAGPLPTPAGALPTPTGALPTPTGPLPTPTGALPTPTGRRRLRRLRSRRPTCDVADADGCVADATSALPTPTSALPTPTLPTPTDATGSGGYDCRWLDGGVRRRLTSGEPTVEDTGSIEPAAGVTTTPEPQQAEASPEDIAKAQDAKPVEEDPPPAPPAEIDKLRDLILDPEGAMAKVSPPPADATLAAAEQQVLQWQPDWVQYDKYYRPLIFNPYPEPLQLVYDVDGVPRLVLIPPFGRMVTEVRDPGSYNFTALRLNAFGVPIDYAVGNFFGGGYFPGPGLPPPPPPPPVRTLTDVPVQVKYASATYRPIVVRKIVDVGPDPTQGGAHKVLLDGVTPAWGEWKQNEQGVPQFEVNQTQSFPGMEAPAQGPLPGNYDLQLVSDSTPTACPARTSP